MSVMMSEKEHAKKRKLFTILGILFIILGFGCFIGGPIAGMATGIFYLFFISVPGVLLIAPGFFMLSLGTQRAITSFTAQSVGPVGVTAAHNYGSAAAREMAGGIKDGFTGENSERYCKYCGNRIDADSEFCEFCGKKLN